MSKKTKPQEALSFLVELLEPDVENMSKEDLADRLSVSGVDVKGFHKRVAGRARELEVKYRKQSGSAPRYLRDAIEQLDPESRLPRKTSAAIEKASSWIDELSRRFPVPSQPVVLESYRKGDVDLSVSDRELLDKERERLLKKLDESDETE